MHRTKRLAASAAVAGLTAIGTIAVGGFDVAGATTPSEPAPVETVAPSTEPALVPDATAPEPVIDDTPAATGDRIISVVGTGDVSVTPDQATVWMGVQTKAATSAAALDTVSEKANALVTTLEAVGVAAEDIQTSGLSMWPDYQENGTTVTGYEASVNVTVTVRDLAKAGEIIDAAQGFVGDGFTLGGISFDSSDPEASMQEARAEAIANARVRAEQYAAAAGASVGEVLRIVESGSTDLSYARMESAAYDTAAGAVPIQPGQQELTASVTVVFALG